MGVVFTATLATSNSAAAAEANAWHIGMGGVSCGEYITASVAPVGDPEHLQVYVYASWVQGFLIGANLADSKSYPNPPDGDAISLWLDNHCRAHPLDELVQAALALSLDLYRRARGVPEKG